MYNGTPLGAASDEPIEMRAIQLDLDSEQKPRMFHLLMTQPVWRWIEPRLPADTGLTNPIGPGQGLYLQLPVDVAVHLCLVADGTFTTPGSTTTRESQAVLNCLGQLLERFEL